MKLNNTFKRELAKALRQKFHSLQIQHEDNHISFKWQELNADLPKGMQMNWIGLTNGGNNQSHVLHTFGFVEKAKSDYYKKIETEILDFSQKFLDDWAKTGKELF